MENKYKKTDLKQLKVSLVGVGLISTIKNLKNILLFWSAQNRRIEKTESPRQSSAAAGTKMNTGQVNWDSLNLCTYFFQQQYVEPLKLLDGHCPAPPRPSGADQLRAGGAANLAGSAESYQTTSASVCHSGWLPVPGHLAGCGQRRGCGCGRGFGQAGCARLGILMNRSKLAPRWHCQLAEPPQQKPLLKRRTVDINNRKWHWNRKNKFLHNFR